MMFQLPEGAAEELRKINTNLEAIYLAVTRLTQATEKQTEELTERLARIERLLAGKGD